MPLRQKEDIDDPGVPLAFLRPGEVMFRDRLSGIFLKTPTIPLDGRVYICSGEIILNNGQRLPAEFELESGKRRPFVKNSVWCTPDNRRTWYQLDEPELVDALSLSRTDIFPIRWQPGAAARRPRRRPVPRRLVSPAREIVRVPTSAPVGKMWVFGYFPFFRQTRLVLQNICLGYGYQSQTS